MMKLNFYFGINSETVEEVPLKSMWNKTNTALPVFAHNFDLSPEINQQIIYNFCQNLIES